MKFYIVDDVRSIVRVLDRIIEQKELGEVIGFSTDAITAIAEIIANGPDIVLVDLLMPVKDGISIVKEVKQVRPDTKFIMISQVSNKEMISDAYNAGIEFFVTKPINIIEVENVVKRVSKEIEMENTLGGLRKILGGGFEEIKEPQTGRDEEPLNSIQYLLGILGMLGERGTADIIAICQRCIKDRDADQESMIKAYCAENGENEKIVRQRIRRAAKRGLVNMAHMAIDDLYNEVYQNYACLVFDYENLKKEMDYLRGNSSEKGKVNLSIFIEGLLLFSEKK